MPASHSIHERLLSASCSQAPLHSYALMLLLQMVMMAMVACCKRF
jgi:hypothetical protein